jgi:hypothetical protein
MKSIMVYVIFGLYILKVIQLYIFKFLLIWIVAFDAIFIGAIIFFLKNSHSFILLLLSSDRIFFYDLLFHRPLINTFAVTICLSKCYIVYVL